jgi:hypothetical protein
MQTRLVLWLFGKVLEHNPEERKLEWTIIYAKGKVKMTINTEKFMLDQDSRLHKISLSRIVTIFYVTEFSKKYNSNRQKIVDRYDSYTTLSDTIMTHDTLIVLKNERR